MASENISLEEEYRKNPDLKKEEVQKLIQWTDEQPHLPELSEFEAIQFLQSKYYNFEDAKKIVEKYFTYRTHFTDIFSNLDVTLDEFSQARKAFTAVCLPGKSLEGYHTILFRIQNQEIGQFNLLSIVRLITVSMITTVYEKGSSEGCILLIDLENLMFKHIFKMNVTAIKHTMAFTQEALPVRLKRIELFNLPSYFNKAFALFRPFIGPELYNLIKIRDTIESTYESVPKEIFPSDYLHGRAPPLEELREKMWKSVLSRRDQFLEEERTKRVDESKRVQTENGMLSKLNFFRK